MSSFKTAGAQMRCLGVAALAVVAGLGVPGLALAEPFAVVTPAIPYEQLGTYTTVILTGLAAMWVIRKLIKTTNRS